MFNSLLSQIIVALLASLAVTRSAPAFAEALAPTVRINGYGRVPLGLGEERYIVDSPAYFVEREPLVAVHPHYAVPIASPHYNVIPVSRPDTFVDVVPVHLPVQPSSSAMGAGFAGNGMAYGAGFGAAMGPGYAPSNEAPMRADRSVAMGSSYGAAMGGGYGAAMGSGYGTAMGGGNNMAMGAGYASGNGPAMGVGHGAALGGGHGAAVAMGNVGYGAPSYAPSFGASGAASHSASFGPGGFGASFGGAHSMAYPVPHPPMPWY